MGSFVISLHRLLTETFILLDDSDRQTLGQHNLSDKILYA